MSNLATTVQLPAHLAALVNQAGSNFHAVGQSMVGGISTGGGHPTINIRQSRWRLNEPGLEEEVLETLHMNVIVVDANPYVSKVYYDGPYNPAAEAKAPPCYSDNGLAPSSRAEKPQSALCSTCPHNVWGSKITPTGKKSKACGDYKKIAVVLADDPTSPVFELRIPGASLQDYSKAISKLVNSGIAVPFIVFKLSFDSTVDYPKIVFTPTSYASEEQMANVKQWVASDEAKQAVGANDVPFQATGVSIPAPAQMPAPVVNAPLPTPTPFIQNPPVQAPQPEQPAQGEPKKRGRRLGSTNAPKVAPTSGGFAMPEAQAPVQAAAAPAASQQMSFDLPGGQTAASAVTLNPTATDADLDAILGNALNV